VEQAVAWRQAGIPAGLHAAQWATAGVTPDTVGDWLAAGIDGFQATRWHKLDFDLAAAQDAVRLGFTLDLAERRGLILPRALTQSPRPRPTRASPAMSPVPADPGRWERIQQLMNHGIRSYLAHGYVARNWDCDDALAWARAGFEAPDALLWQAMGLTPAQAARLEDKGATPAQTVRDWWQAGLPFDEVARWISAGLTAQQAADQRPGASPRSKQRRWATSGRTTADSQDDRRSRPDGTGPASGAQPGTGTPTASGTGPGDSVHRGLTPDTAFASVSGQPAGLPNPGPDSDDFRRFHEACLQQGIQQGQLIQDYEHRNWVTADAVPWAKAGFQVADAMLWRALGLIPAEAGRLERQGATPAHTVRDWWQAGLPFNEVADWIGAGLSLQEAVSQRTRGVTAEQAAALRALRDQEQDASA
jgi:hypothetical protein